jgi:hypothetical protein
MVRDQFSTRIRTPSNCSAEELAAFCAHVNLGKPVANLSSEWVVDHALKLLFVSLGDTLVAVGGLKKPPRGYVQQCFRQAGVPDRWVSYPVELGWIYCTEYLRGGMAYRIIDPLLRECEAKNPIYAVVRSDNLRMSSPLRQRQFRAAGRLYPSIEHPEAMVQLFVRDGQET